MAGPGPGRTLHTQRRQGDDSETTLDRTTAARELAGLSPLGRQAAAARATGLIDWLSEVTRGCLTLLPAPRFTSTAAAVYGVYAQPAVDGTGQQLVEGGLLQTAAQQAAQWAVDFAAATAAGCLL